MRSLARFPDRRWPPRSDADRRWLAASLLVGALCYVAYLSLYPEPAQGAGFYLTAADALRRHGYALPWRVPFYTAGGVPFAYPPLAFYALAVALDLGAAPLALARLVPGLVALAALVPYYALAREVLESPARAGTATALLAITPAALQWHVAAGGLVRAPAFLFALGTCYAGWRLFAAGDRRWLPPAVALFAATVLTHPVYATFAGVSCLAIYAAVDRSPRGVAFGAVVVAGGAVLSAPWWALVLVRHGPGVFAGAAGTHAGLGGGLARLGASFLAPLVALDGDLPFYLLAFGGALALLGRRRALLPLWLLVVGYALRQPRFLFVPGSMAAAVLVVDVLAPRARTALARVHGRGRGASVSSATAGTAVLVALVASVLVVGSVAALAPAAGPRHVPPPDDERYAATPLPPMYVVGGDRAALAWVRANTDHGSRFVVLGDAAEWFPLLSRRPLLVSPWGAEWAGPAAFRRHRDLYDALAACPTADCVTRGLRDAGVDPQYLYVQTGHYTVRRTPHYRGAAARQSFAASPRYEVVFANDAGFVVHVAERSEATS
ncbi:MAG: hypothetical protein ABEJ82_01840 [Haloplanus sp.]